MNFLTPFPVFGSTFNTLNRTWGLKSVYSFESPSYGLIASWIRTEHTVLLNGRHCPTIT